jgi:hypothetical protein
MHIVADQTSKRPSFDSEITLFGATRRTAFIGELSRGLLGAGGVEALR